MQYTIEIEADLWARAMEVLVQEIATPQEMLGSIGESLFNANRARHEKGVDPEGKAWEPLAASTLAQGKRKGGPLNRIGRMLADFHYQVTGDSLQLGFSDGDGFPAKFHQDGSKPHVIAAKNAKALNIGGVFRKKVNHPGLPARTLIGFPQADRDLVGEVIQDHLLLAINRIR